MPETERIDCPGCKGVSKPDCIQCSGSGKVTVLKAHRPTRRGRG